MSILRTISSYFEKTLNSISEKLRFWNWRNLTILGRIQIVKTFAVPILRYRASLVCMDKDIIMEANKILFNFTKETTEILVHAFVSSKLDYCNSLLYGLPKHMISSLQSVQNTAARIVTVTKKFWSPLYWFNCTGYLFTFGFFLKFYC